VSSAASLRRAWKRLPVPVRRAANETAQAIHRSFTPLRVSRWWRRGRPASAPVTVAGVHRAVIGIGAGVRLFTDALRSGGLEVHVLDVSEPLGVPARLAGAEAPPPPDEGVLMSHLNPPELLRYLHRTGGRALRGKRHVGYWAWELPVAPDVWRGAFRYVDEVWAPSGFTADAIRALAPLNMRVEVVGHPIFMTPRPADDRSRFDLPAGGCVVLLAFDLRSTAARKNPFGALEAYERAFPEPDASRLLVCKIVGSDADPRSRSRLEAHVARRPDLRLIDEEISSEAMLTLLASSDVVLSLHRAEGFGLLLAEGMWLGKAVIATGWSGNMDFMDADSAALVRHRLIEVDDPQGMYAGGCWAEPDLDHAAELLRRLVDNAGFRRELGARARRRAEEAFDRDRWLRDVASRLGARP